jgi:hypothetical protein
LVGDDDSVNGSGQMLYCRQRLERLQKKVHNAEHIDRGLLIAGLGLAVIFAIDVALRANGQYLLPIHLRGWLLWALALLPDYAAIFEIYLSEKADRALIPAISVHVFALWVCRERAACGQIGGAQARDLAIVGLRVPQ